MIFDRGIAQTLMGRGILIPMGWTTTGTANGNSSITIYTGAQPNANILISNWTSYNTSYLLHRSNVLFYMPFPETETNASFITLRTAPLAQTAINSGEAQWCIIWMGNQTESNVRNSTITSNSFILAPVSNVFGNGLVKLDNTSVISTNTFNIVDATISISVG